MAFSALWRAEGVNFGPKWLYGIYEWPLSANVVAEIHQGLKSENSWYLSKIFESSWVSISLIGKPLDVLTKVPTAREQLKQGQKFPIHSSREDFYPYAEDFYAGQWVSWSMLKLMLYCCVFWSSEVVIKQIFRLGKLWHVQLYKQLLRLWNCLTHAAHIMSKALFSVSKFAWPLLPVLSCHDSGNESSNEIRANALKMTSSINEILDAMRATNCGGLTFFNRIPGLPPLTFIGEKSFKYLCRYPSTRLRDG